MGNAHLSLFPYEPLATGDGELIVVAGNDAQYRKLVAELGAPELGKAPRFATVAARNENREELRPLLLDLLSRKSADQWFNQLSAVGVVCGPINDIKGGVELAERLGLEPVVEIDGVPSVRNPISFSRRTLRYDLPPPALDGDADYIRAWLKAPNTRDAASNQVTGPEELRSV